MKKLLTLISMFAVTLSSWALKVGDTFNSSNGDYTYEVKYAATSSSAGKIAVKSYNNTTATSSKIALSLMGPDGYIYDITSIEEKAYYDRSNITNITIGSNVTSIGFEAFSGTNIKTLEIPSAVTYINIGFTISCNKLEEITVAEWNKTFASYDGALYTKDLTKLRTMPAAKKTATYPSQLTTIGSYAFAYSTMETIEIPYGVTALDMMPFFLIKSKTVVIPSSVKDFYVTSDGEGPFFGGNNLTDVYLNTNSIPFPNPDNFISASQRKNVHLYVRPELVSQYKEQWPGFIFLEDICAYDVSEGNVDYSITSTSRETINGVQYDGRACTVPGRHLIHTGERHIPAYLTANNGKKYAVTTIGTGTFRFHKTNGSVELEKVTGCENVDIVESFAFSACKDLKSISLPNVSNINSDAFSECIALSSFTFNKNIKRIGDSAFEKSGLASDVVLPYGIEYLGSNVFKGTKVATIFVPWIKSFSTLSFTGMTNLSSLYFNNANPNIVRLLNLTGIPSTCTLYVPSDDLDEWRKTSEFNSKFKEIKSGACDFTYGSALSNVKSNPYRITVISNTPFTQDGVEYAGTAMYVNYSNMGNMAAFKGSPSELNQFYGANKRYKMVKIGNHCFEGATKMVDPGIAQMTFLEEIGDYAFNGLSAMSEIKIPAKVRRIGDNAFDGCSKLTTIIAEPTLPPTVYPSTFFSKLYNQATLKVHNISLFQYTEVKYWKSFLKIESIEGDDYKMGDVDGNGVVDITDANILINIILNMDKASNYDGRADVNGDGDVDVSDANAVINTILNL